MIDEPAAYYKSAVIYSGGIFRKEPLPRRENPLSEQSYLTAVRMAAAYYIYVKRFYKAVVVFGMMAKQKLASAEISETFKPLSIDQQQVFGNTGA